LLAIVGLLGCDDGDGGGGGQPVMVLAPRAPDATIAFRDGDGPWTVKKGTQAPFSFSVASADYTVAIACPTSKVVKSFQATPEELASVEYWDECRPLASTLTAHFIGNGTNGNRVSWGPSIAARGTISNGDYMLPVPHGTEDFLATRGGGQFADKVVLVRDLDISSDTTVDVDFDATTAITPETATVSAGPVLYTSFVTNSGVSIDLSVANSLAVVVPVALMTTGDLHAFSIGTDDSPGGPRFSGSVTTARTPPSIVKSPMFPSEQPNVALEPAGTHLVATATWSAQPTAVMYELAVSTNDRSWQSLISADVFAADGLLETPDPSTAAGWDPATLLVPGSSAWRVRYLTGMPCKEIVRQFPSVEGVVGYAGWTE
jgi:hypothetical protein